MAQPVSSNPEVAQHHATQVGLAAALASALRRLGIPGDWRNRKEFAAYANAAATVTQQFSTASISLSADYYDAMRDQAGVTGSFRTPIRSPWDVANIEAYIDAASEKLLADLETPPQDILDQIEAAAQKIVLDAGRFEVLDAVGADREATAWARVARPGACSFCRLLATRGPVYLTEQTASFKAHSRFDGRGGDCQCIAEPLFGHYEPTAQARADLALYADVTTGLRGREARNAFRQAIDAQNSR